MKLSIEIEEQLSSLFGSLKEAAPLFENIVSTVAVGSGSADYAPVCVFSRKSTNSYTKTVAVVCFSNKNAAISFSAFVSPILPHSCRGAKVRYYQDLGLWGVSIPCSPCSSTFVNLI